MKLPPSIGCFFLQHMNVMQIEIRKKAAPSFHFESNIDDIAYIKKVANTLKPIM